MNTYLLIFFMLLGYLHLGWCWADICTSMEWLKKQRPRLAYALTILLWPASMMMIDSVLSEGHEDDYHEE
ncbi:MAG: hypothetical protein RR680_17470 [Hafnia sp.]